MSRLDPFHPAVARWFEARFGAPTEPQVLAWPSIRARRHTLIAAPTGSGKTLAAFLAVLDDLVRGGLDSGGLPDETHVVYVSPLKALSNDVQRNLEEPLEGIRRELARAGLDDVEIRTLVRTGDTPAASRAAMIRRPPHVLVTTPESLYVLLTSDGGRRVLRTARTVIVDEIHAMAGNKRGSHLSLSLERLEALVRASGSGPLLRVGLSATQRPLDEMARFLVGAGGLGPDGSADCAIVDVGHRRDLDLTIEVPRSPLEAVMAQEVWTEVYDRLAELALEHRTTLIFVNTRRMAERLARHLGERLGEESVGAHHGSLSREQRQRAERRLKAGELRALVATASLELGIDIGSVELVCVIGSPRSISALLQRAGRSGHRLGDLPRARVFPTSRDELVECAALLDAVRRGELERLEIPPRPLDILAQQIVAELACSPWGEQELYGLVRRAHPYRDLTEEEFGGVVRMLAEGFSTRRGRRGALVHHDAVNGRLRGRRGARLTAITSGGAIPDTADYHVVLEPSGTALGTINEDFAIESVPGDIFQLGNASWRIRRVEQGRVLVEDARGEPPNLPFWLGEAPARSRELSRAVARLRDTLEVLEAANAVRWLEEIGVGASAGEQIVEYLVAARAALGTLPGEETLVLERFFDEAGNQHLVIHSPNGGRINRAWGLALRKRFCRRFNFELQAAATEDSIVLSLGPTHSFPAADVFGFLRADSVRDVLVQALLDAPMFTIRWRWNTSRALAVPRFRGGRRVPPRLQRMQAEDLIAVVFPDQLACRENIPGEREIPDHPLVRQTIGDCLQEAMDLAGLERLLRRIEAGEIRLVARDLREPSPLAHEVLGARPFAFLDDAPLEERRTQAVFARRWLDAESAADLGRLDPEAIARVRAEAWPEAESPDELHDALFTLGFLTAQEGRSAGWEPLLDALVAEHRATRFHAGEREPELWVAAERWPELAAVFPGASPSPPIEAPPRFAARTWTAEEAVLELLRGRLEALGPVTVEELARPSGLDARAVEAALAALEAEGFVMSGSFTPDRSAGAVEWCERRLLARIHRGTIERLRREIQPVSKADFMRFLLAWQRVDPAERVLGADGLAAILEQLEGFEAPAAAWEGEILPARLAEYDPVWLDALCLSGRFVWRRVTPPRRDGGSRVGPVKLTPIALLRRDRLDVWGARTAPAGDSLAALSHAAQAVAGYLAGRGASFFGEIASGTGLLRTQVEEALGELVASGLATADAYTGLRALLTPSNRRPGLGSRSKRSAAVFGMENAGRWSLLRGGAPEADPTASPSPEALEHVVRTLLRRYGVVFRGLLDRESLVPPWRELVRVLRRLEARGEIRGGRFVEGQSGEQFALSEAVGRLRSIRRKQENGEQVSISAADPLNLPGIAVTDARVPVHPANRILLGDGQAVAVLEAGEVRFLQALDPAPQWEARNALQRRRVPPRLRSYLGRPA